MTLLWKISYMIGWGMLRYVATFQSECLGQYNAKSWHVWKREFNLDWIFDTSNILNNYYCYYFMVILDAVFIVPSQYSFLKLQLYVLKKLWNDFCCIVFLFPSAWKTCLTFSKSFFELEILMFLPIRVSFLSYISKYKAVYLAKKSTRGRIRDTVLWKDAKL